MSATNEQLGLVPFETALERAAAAGLDLVEMAAKADPPVCRIMDFGKYQYEEGKRAKDAKRKQVQQKVKEIKLHPNIDTNDFTTKVKHSVAFLEKGDKVKVLLAFRGREMAHPELGNQVLDRFLQAVSDVSVLDAPPKQLGKSIIAVVAPKPQK